MAILEEAEFYMDNPGASKRDFEFQKRLNQKYPSGLPIGLKVEKTNGVSVLADDSGYIILNEVNFPDAILLADIKTQTGEEDRATSMQLAAVTTLYLNNAGGACPVSTLYGIELLPNLISATFAYMPNLKSADISFNTELTTINLVGCTELDNLNIDGITKLEYLYLADTKIYNINLSKMNNLQSFMLPWQAKPCVVTWPKNPNFKYNVYVSFMQTLDTINFDDVGRISISPLRTLGLTLCFGNQGGAVSYSYSFDTNGILIYEFSGANSCIVIATVPPMGAQVQSGGIRPSSYPELFDSLGSTKVVYMVENGLIVSKGGTINGTNIDVAAGGVIITGNGYYVLTNGGTVTKAGTITSNGAGTWTPVVITTESQQISAGSGSPVAIGSGALINHQ